MRLARLVRFYHLDPRALASMPEWLFGPLEEHLPAVMSEELDEMLAVALSPHSREVLASVQESIARGRAHLFPEDMPEFVERDPVKAAEWFESIGVQVVN